MRRSLELVPATRWQEPQQEHVDAALLLMHPATSQPLTHLSTHLPTARPARACLPTSCCPSYWRQQRRRACVLHSTWSLTQVRAENHGMALPLASTAAQRASCATRRRLLSGGGATLPAPTAAFTAPPPLETCVRDPGWCPQGAARQPRGKTCSTSCAAWAARRRCCACAGAAPRWPLAPVAMTPRRVAR